MYYDYRVKENLKQLSSVGPVVSQKVFLKALCQCIRAKNRNRDL